MSGDILKKRKKYVFIFPAVIWPPRELKIYEKVYLYSATSITPEYKIWIGVI